MDPNCFSFIRYQCILYDSVVHVWESWNFYKLKMGDLVSWGNWFYRKSELFGPPLLYLNFKSFMDPNSSSFIKSQCIVHDSGELFSESWNLSKLKQGDLISTGNQFCRKWFIWSPILYLNFKSFIAPNSSSFIRFLCILHGSRVLFSESWTFYKLKRGGT